METVIPSKFIAVPLEARDRHREHKPNDESLASRIPSPRKSQLPAPCTAILRQCTIHPMPLDTLNKTAIATTDAPAAIGPYSQAILSGNTLYTSGQVALDPATGSLVPGGIAEQTTRVLDNLKAVLAASGLDLAHVVKTTVFLKDMADFAAMNAIYATYFAPDGVIAPARSTVQVAALPKDALVEIECIAKSPSA